MKNLKSKIIKYFIFCSLGISVVESMIDSIYDEWLFLLVKSESVLMKLSLASYLLLSILVFVVFAFLFIRMAGKRIEEETNRQLEEKNQLYANIAHDLKTPITSIRGFAGAIKENNLSEDESQRAIDIIYTKSKRTDELIEMIFTYSKLESNQYQLNLQKENVCGLLRVMIADAYEDFESRNIGLKIEIPDEPIYCMLDRIEFKRAMNNLIDNAYKHNREGCLVCISVKEVERKVRILVADTGDVIEASIGETIFQPFVCGDDSRNSKGGSGLGLAISKKIFEKHHGTLRLVDQVEGYTKGFMVELLGGGEWKSKQ